MSSLRNLLCAAAAVGLIFSSSTAEARFGKRSNSSSSVEKREKKKSKSHEATAVGEEDSDGDSQASSSSRSSSSRSRSSRVSSGVSAFFTVLDVISTVGEVAAASNSSSVSYSTTTTTYSAPPPAPAVEVRTSTKTKSSAPLMFRLGADGAPLGGGTAVGLFLTIDGKRMGGDARGTDLTLPTDDGTSGTDNITLGTVHLTYAMIARERLRLRLEGGMSMASAPSISMAGPSMALSLEACLVGDLDLELRAQGTAFPYQHVDAQAGLAVNLASLVLRGGWRGLYLNDAGLVDGVEHADAFSGPYVGLGFSF